MPTNADLARELCGRFPKAPSRTLAKRLHEENPERFSSIESARNSIRAVRGALDSGSGGGRGSIKVTHARPKGKAGWAPECPPSAAEPWTPFKLDAPCRVVSLSDLHVPYHDKRAIESAVAFAKKQFKPDVLLINGDFGDFYQCSRWEKNPKARDLKDELDTQKAMLSWLCGQFPKSRRIFKRGNHDDRWNKYIWNFAPQLWNVDNVQLRNMLDFDKFGFEEVGDEPVMAGMLPIFHGHELPKGISNPVNPARGAFLRTNHTVLIGHLHRSSTHVEPDLWKSETTCWSQGCLCDMAPEYARINKWSHGFAVIDVDKGGEFNLHNFKIAQDGTVRTV